MIMLAAAFAVQAPVPKTEVWDRRLSWGCLVTSGVDKPFVINGIVAQRNEPSHPNQHSRFEHALRVIRDDSDAFANQQARWPMLIVRRPDVFWAYFKKPGSNKFSTHYLILEAPVGGGRGAISLFRADGPDLKPYAKGTCLSRAQGQKK